MEVDPGQEVQVDFGQGAWVIEEGRRRRPHLFRMVLSHARKGYSEAVWRQTSESFIRCLLSDNYSFPVESFNCRSSSVFHFIRPPYGIAS